MKSYSVFAFLSLSVLLAQAQTSPDQFDPCKLLPPSARPDSCYPPDPHPFLHITVTFCFCIAFALLVLYLGGAFKRQHDFRLSEEEGRQLSDRLSEALGNVRGLRGAALRRQCRMIVRGLLLSVDFTLQSAREYYMDHEPEDKAILNCIGSILRTGGRLRFYLNRTRTMLIFPPLVSRASKRTLKAVSQYQELVELIKRCNARMPDSASALPILEFRPAECSGN